MSKARKVMRASVEDLHPSDVAAQRTAEEGAAAVVDAFVSDHYEAIVAMFQTYPDDDAEGRFAALRERFWVDTVPVDGAPATGPSERR